MSTKSPKKLLPILVSTLLQNQVSEGRLWYQKVTRNPYFRFWKKKTTRNFIRTNIFSCLRSSHKIIIEDQKFLARMPILIRHVRMSPLNKILVIPQRTRCNLWMSSFRISRISSMKSVLIIVLINYTRWWLSFKTFTYFELVLLNFIYTSLCKFHLNFTLIFKV